MAQNPLNNPPTSQGVEVSLYDQMIAGGLRVPSVRQKLATLGRETWRYVDVRDNATLVTTNGLLARHILRSKDDSIQGKGESLHLIEYTEEDNWIGVRGMKRWTFIFQRYEQI